MNKLITIIASCLFLLTFMSSCNRTDEERSHILKVYNWADYIDEDVLAEFPAWYIERSQLPLDGNEGSEQTVRA